MDQIDSFAKLVLHFDGTDGATSFPDSSWSPHTVTVNGNAQVDTAQSKFGGASLLLDGSGDNLTLDGSSDFAFGTGDFTVDFWVRRNAVTGANEIFYDSRPAGDPGSFSPLIYFRTISQGIAFFANGANLILGTSPVPIGVWHHVALARSGTNTRLFLNGVQEGSTFTGDTNNYVVGASRPIIGTGGPVGGLELNGWIDELRVSKGVARWTANFTPPGSAYVDERAAVGTFALTGVAASCKTTLPATATSYALTGQAAILTPKAVATVGAFAETGQAALFSINYPVTVGTYALTGNATALTPTAIARTGSYALTIAVTFTDTLAADAQSYAVLWQTFSDVETIAANAGAYTFTGNNANLSYDIDLGGVGSSISGGTFSRDRWRGLKELEAAARQQAERDRERVETQAREAAAQKATEERSAIAARRHLEDETNARLASERALADALQAFSGLSRMSGSGVENAILQAAQRAEIERTAAAQEEEEAIVHLLLVA